METGQIILTILLLIIVIALGFSYSEEVSSNRRLRGQLKMQIRRGGLVEDPARRRLKEIEALEHTIALKDETIKHLNGDIAKLKFDYAAEVAGRNEGKEVTQGKAFEPSRLRGEGVDYSEPVKIESIIDCEECKGTGLIYENPLKRVPCGNCDGEGAFSL